MARVSKHALSAEEKRVLVKQCAQLLSAKTPHTQELFLAEMLTETEQLIVLKRIAAVILIDQKYTTYEIARTLKLSPASVSNYRKQVTNGGFVTLLKHVRGASFDATTFWKTVDKVLRLGLPPIAGPGRWKHIAPNAVRTARTK